MRQLTVKHNYRLITMTDSLQEIWLESENRNSYPVVRLMLHDLDWASWLKRDINRTLRNGEDIRKQLMKKPISVLSVYVSKYAPVDDYDFAGKPYQLGKTKVDSFILNTESGFHQLDELEQKLGLLLDMEVPATIEESDLEALQKEAFAASLAKAKEEQGAFHSGKPFFTYVFIFLQMVMYLFMWADGGTTNPETLIAYGAKYTPAIADGEWWRFFTPIIIHIGFIHLLMNTVTLYLIGSDVERIYGRMRFLVIYLFSGFMGSLASFLIMPNTISAGASGAIFGCFGALLYFGVAHPKLFFRTIGSSVIILIIINLGIGFSISGIDNAGHIGGLIGGFLAAGAVHLPKKKAWTRQLLFLVGTVILTAVLLKIGYSR
ncbi:rhomboid family intramembrane serine protease [Bacillus massiliglaciei]|uniref:rhomboid family intramembrane serine protease n=1 Tax=Bacillus massiliglaciei TaxID=1816693 RepID=UPI001F3FE208|nr:rhomboid family intramembrane serine protease [Bacillus massiliglaciei]